MAKCEDCGYFFPLPQDADGYEAGKGDCVNQKEDEKGRYWLSKPVTVSTESCGTFQKR